MATLRTPNVTDAYGNALRGTDAAYVRAHRRALVRHGIAQLVYCLGYPLLAFALWIGARDGNWTRASVLVALGVVLSFIGWGLLSAAEVERGVPAASYGGSRPVPSNVFLALYNRAGAIVVVIGSYAVTALSQGWPTPHTFGGWFVLVWVPLLVAFVVPVERSRARFDRYE